MSSLIIKMKSIYVVFVQINTQYGLFHGRTASTPSMSVLTEATSQEAHSRSVSENPARLGILEW